MNQLRRWWKKKKKCKKPYWLVYLLSRLIGKIQYYCKSTTQNIRIALDIVTFFFNETSLLRQWNHNLCEISSLKLNINILFYNIFCIKYINKIKFYSDITVFWMDWRRKSQVCRSLAITKTEFTSAESVFQNWALH